MAETTTKIPCPGWTENGNAFAIVGTVCRCMRRAGRSQDEIDAYRADAIGSDYDHLLRVTVTVVEDDPIMELREAFGDEVTALHEIEGSE
jgi:hypothetical protein